MFGHELTVEQRGTGPAQRRHQPGERNLRCVGHPAEHRFAAEHPVEPDAIESADQRTIAPAFNRMSRAYFVQCKVAAFDSVTDPRAAAIAPGTGAGADHFGKGGVAGHRKCAFAQNLGQRARAVETVQWQDRPAARFDPENLGIVARIRHRKHAGAIRHQQQFRVDRGRIGGGVHGNSSYGPLRHACHRAVLRLERLPPAGV